MKGTWQTTDSGGPGLGLLVIIGLVLAVGSGGAAAFVNAIGNLLAMVLVALVVLAVSGVAVVAGVLIWQRRRPAGPARVVVRAQPAQRPVRPAPPRPALPAPQIHLHLHGPVTAADLAAIVAQHAHPIEEDNPPC